MPRGAAQGMKTAVLTAMYLIGAAFAAIGIGRAGLPGLDAAPAWSPLMRPLAIAYETALYWGLELLYRASGADAPVRLADAVLAAVIFAAMLAPGMFRGLAARQAAASAACVALVLALNHALGA